MCNLSAKDFAPKNRRLLGMLFVPSVNFSGDFYLRGMLTTSHIEGGPHPGGGNTQHKGEALLLKGLSLGGGRG